jgi:hypothetical protein
MHVIFSTHAFFLRILSNLCLCRFLTALGSLFHPPFDFRYTSVLLLKWENDGRTMGELKNKERRKNDRAYVGHQAGKKDKTVIISFFISHVSALLLNDLWRRLDWIWVEQPKNNG